MKRSASSAQSELAAVEASSLQPLPVELGVVPDRPLREAPRRVRDRALRDHAELGRRPTTCRRFHWSAMLTLRLDAAEPAGVRGEREVLVVAAVAGDADLARRRRPRRGRPAGRRAAAPRPGRSAGGRRRCAPTASGAVTARCSARTLAGDQSGWPATPEPPLRGEHELVAAAGRGGGRCAPRSRRSRSAVSTRVTPRSRAAVEQRGGLGLGDVGLADLPGAQPDHRDVEAGPAEGSLLHVSARTWPGPPTRSPRPGRAGRDRARGCSARATTEASRSTVARRVGVDEGEVRRLADRERTALVGQPGDVRGHGRHPGRDLAPAQGAGADHRLDDHGERGLQPEHPGRASTKACSLSWRACGAWSVATTSIVPSASASRTAATSSALRSGGLTLNVGS